MLTNHRSDPNAVLVGEPNLADLDKICEALNSPAHPAKQKELRELVTKWRNSGPNLERMLEADPALEGELRGSWFGKYMAGKNARAHILLRPTKLKHNHHEYAVGMFAALTLHPDCEKLSGPCAYARCGKFFLQKTKRRTAYCSRRCNQKAGGLNHRRRQLEKEREEKLAKAEVAIRRWRTARTNDDWKTSVCKQVPEITGRFLTRAVNKGDLLAPKETKSKRSSGH